MIAQPEAFGRIFALAITVLGLASGCASDTASRVGNDERPATRRATVGEQAAHFALDQVGTPYRYGGHSPSGFDCSGLVHYAYGRAGKAMPRTTGQLWSSTTPVGRGQLRVGDLLFFRIEGKMQHVGLYVGGRRFVHAPSTGRQVSIESLDSPFYQQAFLRGGRPR